MTPAQRKARSRKQLLELNLVAESGRWTRSVCVQILGRAELDGSAHSLAALERLTKLVTSC
jgi:hypothetical protein